MTHALVEALNSFQLERAASLFADDGCFVTPDATVVRGHDGVKKVLAQLTPGAVRLRATPGNARVAGYMALCHERWTFTYRCREAPPFTRVSDATILLRRFDRGWRLSIVALGAS